MMLFSEVYGTYYNILAKLLQQAQEGRLDRDSMYRIVRETGFEESVLTIPDAIEKGSWPVITPNFSTPLTHKPTMPLTALQKSWLKSLLSDPRIQLFDPPAEGLEDVAPLYPADAVVYYDRYLDGDPFDDPQYIARFRCILSAIRQNCWLEIRFIGHRGQTHSWRCQPSRLEYSQKDDKFRLICAGKQEDRTINLGRITDCRILPDSTAESAPPPKLKKKTLVLELTDKRNALERAMLHFSHLSKETERIGDQKYRLTLYYEHPDETELLIRVLSFGPVVKIVSPDDFKSRFTERLEKQKKLRIQT